MSVRVKNKVAQSGGSTMKALAKRIVNNTKRIDPEFRELKSAVSGSRVRWTL